MMETTEVPDDNAPGELDVVRVRHTLPEHNIAAGAKGTVVMVHDTPGLPPHTRWSFPAPTARRWHWSPFNRTTSTSPGDSGDR